jgi:hypothetical protein
MSADDSLAFQVSDLTIPTAQLEGWRKLVAQIQPSQGPGSGQFDPQTGTASGVQWLRRFNLTIYKPGAAAAPAAAAGPATPSAIPAARSGNGGSSIELPPVEVTAAPDVQSQSPGHDVSKLRCYFNIKKSTNSSPNFLYARIYNLSPATMAKVIEFTRVRVQAGYQYGYYGIIFDGTVVQYTRGKENPVDTFLDIYAGDGDQAFNGAFLLDVVPANSPVLENYNKAIQAAQAAQPDLQVGQQDQKTIQDRTIRAHYLMDARAAWRELQQQYGQDIYVENGVLNIVRRDGYKTGEAVILSPRTGLVGLPEVTAQGIQIRCLLNPRIRLGGLVKIDSSVLSGVPYIPGTAAQRDAQGNVVGFGDPTTPNTTVGGTLVQTALYNQTFTAAFTSPRGLYKVAMMNYTGDTHGQSWYCDLVCIAVNSAGTLSISNGSAYDRAGLEAFRGGLTTPVAPG